MEIVEKGGQNILLIISEIGHLLSGWFLQWIHGSLQRRSSPLKRCGIFELSPIKLICVLCLYSVWESRVIAHVMFSLNIMLDKPQHNNLRTFFCPADVQCSCSMNIVHHDMFIIITNITSPFLQHSPMKTCSKPLEPRMVLARSYIPNLSFYHHMYHS